MNNKTGKDFVQSEFVYPSAENNLLYTWVWNAPISTELIDETLSNFKKAGIDGFYILPLPENFRVKTMKTNLKPAYLSIEFFELVKYAIEQAVALDMEVWLYDEGGWPSGGACGNTCKQNPKARETLLYRREITLKKGEKYIPSADSVAAFTGKTRLDEGFVCNKDITFTEYYASKPIGDCGNHPNCVDSTNKSVIDTFINNTYEAYKNGLGDTFNKTSAIFTDEPSVVSRLIPENFFEVFYKKYGYDIKAFIYCIYDINLAVTPEEQLARIHYGRLLGDLFYTNFCKNISNWCKMNNSMLSGHLNLDHIPEGASKQCYFSHLRCLSAFDIPGVDVIWHQIQIPQNGNPAVKEGAPFFSRLASSAAHQTRKNLALTESFAVYGDGVTPDEFRYVLNFQAVRGINVFNVMLISAVDTKMASLLERPSFSSQKPGYYNMNHINMYYKRLSYLLRLGEPQTDTALYIPCADFWANEDVAEKAKQGYIKAGCDMENMGIEFDIADDYAIFNAEDTGKGLKIGDMIYKNIVVPRCDFMPGEVKDKIAPYVKELPEVEKKSQLRVMKRKLQSGMLYFMFNESEESIEYEVEFKNSYRLDALTGEVFLHTSPGVLINSGDIAIFYVTENALRTEIDKKEYSLEIKGFKPVGAKKCEITFEGVFMKEAPADVKAGNDFSGEITYRAEYELPAMPKAFERFAIELEDTSVSARISINGKSVATVGLTPMRAMIPALCLDKKGTIEITVSNTGANEIEAGNQLILTHPPEVVGPYHNMSLEYEKGAPVIKLGKVTIIKYKE